MSDDPRVQRLLDELQESDSTPEEVCHSTPELLSAVRSRWLQIRRVENELDAFFPPPAETVARQPTPQPGGNSLPSIPGYEVNAMLGRGGMGVVFRARHLRLNRVVALKMAIAGAHAGPHERERFQREAEAVATLRHPNVVQIYDVGDFDGMPYFAMEYVEGGSLAQKLAGTPLPPRQAAALLATLAGAIHAAHQSRIVHRDLKPANVLLTADGAPKISDFGLARRLDGEAGLTATGTVVGTPSYMAPEQATGAMDATGPAVDVYSLGSILYEMLTGRPPYRAETAAETVHQLLTQDPVPPSRLNGKVPRDLETICLKCLHKEPRLRYATATELAEDVGRFLRGEAISARPEGFRTRLARRVRRRPVLSASIAVATLSTLALFAGGIWTFTEREAGRNAALVAEREAEKDLSEMAALLRNAAWPEAKAALERARGRIGDASPPELRHRLERGTRDLKLGVELDAICINGAEMFDDGSFAFERSDKQCEAAFRDAGFGNVYDDPAEVVAERIAASDIANALVDALDHWAIRVEERDPSRKARLFSISREVVKRFPVQDPTGWRDRARNPEVWKDAAAFNALVEETNFAENSVPLLLAIAQQVRERMANPVPFLRRIQMEHSDDFWANYCLARVLLYTREYAEALRFYQAAAATRKDSESAHGMIGNSLIRLERYDEAIEQYRHLLRVAPSPLSHRFLGIGLVSQAKFREALEHFRIAFQHFPDDAELLAVYGTALLSTGKPDEAFEKFQAAVAKDPNRASAYFGLRELFVRQGRQDKAFVAWGKALDCDPPPSEHKLWYGYAETCLGHRKEAEYRHARTALLKTFGKTADPYTAERTARACLLLSAPADEMDQAAALADRAFTADPGTYLKGAFPNFAFVKALADYRRGQYAPCIARLRGEAAPMAGPSPRLVLAMALHRSGQLVEARKTLALSVASYDWRISRVRDQDGCIAHVLRREAETMILAKLPEFLAGKRQPDDQDERIALIGFCQAENRPLAVATLSTEIFKADPALADDVRTGHRYKAACAATQAGLGNADAARLKEEERAQLRKQATEWLRADLAGWGKAVDVSTFPSTSERAKRTLTEWQNDPDLKVLRDPADLEKLPADERKECVVLWEEVAKAIKRYELVK